MKLDQRITQRFADLTASGVANPGGSYEAFTQWFTAVMSLIERTFGVQSHYHQHLSDAYVVFKSHGPMGSVIERTRGVLASAKADYEAGYLIRQRTLLRADLAEDVLTQAEELLTAGYKDPACVLAGVTLELALRDLCERENIPMAKLDRMNSDLAEKDIYNKGMQKQITAWADRRNAAAHGKWGDYSDADVRDMVAGIRRFVADHL